MTPPKPGRSLLGCASALDLSDWASFVSFGDGGSVDDAAVAAAFEHGRTSAGNVRFTSPISASVPSGSIPPSPPVVVFEEGSCSLVRSWTPPSQRFLPVTPSGGAIAEELMPPPLLPPPPLAEPRLSPSKVPSVGSSQPGFGAVVGGGPLARSGLPPHLGTVQLPSSRTRP